MARALANDPINQLEENLQCTVCLEVLTDPKTLPCCHSFCKDCLERIVETCRGKAPRGQPIREFPCPYCRATFILDPDKHVADMPRNHFICNMVTMAAVLDRGTRVPCSHNCSQSYSVARCVTCEKFLCRECLTAHNNYRANNGHSVLTMEELSKPENRKKINDKMYCNEHSGKKLKVYCETCDQLICRDCMDFKHVKQGHSCVLVKDVANNYKRLLASNNKIMDEALTKGNAFLQQLTLTTEQFDRDAENVRIQIAQKKDTVLKTVTEMLEQKTKTLLKNLDDIRKAEREKFGKQAEETKLYVEKIKTSVQLSKMLVDKGTEEEIISNHKIIMDNAKSLLTDHKKYFEAPIPDVNVSYTSSTSDEPISKDTLLKLAKSLGEVHEKKKDAGVRKVLETRPHTLEGSELTTRQKKVEFSENDQVFVEEKTNRRDDVIEILPVHLKLLQKLPSFQRLATSLKRNGCEIHLDDTKGKITVKGSQAQIQKLKNETQDIVGRFDERSLNQSKFSLLKTPKGLSHVITLLPTTNLMVEVNDQGNVMLYGTDQSEVQRGYNIIEKAIVEMELPPSLFIVLKTKECQDALLKVLGTSIPLILQTGEEQLRIICFKKHQQNLNLKIEDFLKRRKPIDKRIPLTKVILRYLSLHGEKLFDNLRLASPGLNIEIGNDAVVVSGERPLVDNCCASIEQFTRDLKFASMDYGTPETAARIKEKGANAIIQTIERKHRCGIVVVIKEETDVRRTLRTSPTSPVCNLNENRERTMQCRYKYPNGKIIEIHQGDILNHAVYYLVNEANDQMKHSGGLAGAIVEKGGRKIQTDCARALQDQGRDRLMPGDVITTNSGGNLNCKKIVHVVVPKHRDTPDGDEAREEMYLRHCCNHVLKQATNGQTIAIPVLGTGIHNIPHDISAKTLVCAAHEFLQEHPTHPLKEVHFVDNNPPAIEALMKEMTTRFAHDPNFHINELARDRWRPYVGAARVAPSSGHVVFVPTAKTKPTLFGSLFSAKDKKKNYGLRKVTDLQTGTLRTRQQITLEIAAESLNDITKIKEELKQVEAEQSHSEIIEFKKQLDEAQHAEILEVQEIHNVRIECEPATGFIRISGLAKNVSNAVREIYPLIFAWEQEKHNTDATNGREVQWFYYETDARYVIPEKYTNRLNAKIERAYNNNPAGSVKLGDEIKYEIDFKTMTEKCMDPNENAILQVYRRPCDAFPLPPNWEYQPIDCSTRKEFVVYSVDVDTPETVDEYNKIHDMFTASVTTVLPNVQVVKIERIQNPKLYQIYEGQKKNMINDGNEMRLFHGTAKTSLDAINTNGFTRAYCGKNAVRLGKGSYFATQAWYSARKNYSTPDENGLQYMYIARVLVGKYTKGKQGLLLPPPIDESNQLACYDSVVDDVAKPTIFVIFHDYQSYPEYLITFRS